MTQIAKPTIQQIARLERLRKLIRECQMRKTPMNHARATKLGIIADREFKKMYQVKGI